MKTKNIMICTDCGFHELLWLADDPEWQCDECISNEDDGVPWGIECNDDFGREYDANI